MFNDSLKFINAYMTHYAIFIILANCVNLNKLLLGLHVKVGNYRVYS